MSWMKVATLASAMALLLGAALMLGSASDAVTGSPGRSGEAIKVHGHWRIEVREADGTLAKVHEFENKLQNWGGALLALVLGRTLKVESWFIRIGYGPCQEGVSSGQCLLVEPSWNQNPSSLVFKTLQIKPPEGFPSDAMTPAEPLTLTGSFTAGNTNPIREVLTEVLFSSSSAQIPGGTREFSRKEFDPGIQLTAGQLVQVTVKFSFQ